MTEAPELSRIFKTSRLDTGAQTGSLSADVDEQMALAQRFDLPEISGLVAEYRLSTRGDHIVFAGTLNANLEQQCVISGEAFPIEIKEAFEILFVEKSQSDNDVSEIELQSEECDEIQYEGGQIDLGEAIAQTLYLALDPYPRGPDADRIVEEKGLQEDERTGPFAALAALKGEPD